MIRNESEYTKAVARVQEEERRYVETVEALKTQGFPPDQVERVMAPTLSFHLQLKEEVEAYEWLVRGDVAEIENLHGLGKMLIGLRIARGLTQKELAARLGVSEPQISRDERNEYHGITVDRAARILDALNVTVTSTVERPVIREPEPQEFAYA